MKHRGILKRLGTVLLGLTLALSLLPTAALAADGPIASIDLSNLSTETGDTGWKWENNTLTLTNCDLTFSGDGFILPDGATVRVSGSNTIRYNQTGSGSTGIKAGSDTGSSGLTIQGDSMDDKLTLIYSVSGNGVDDNDLSQFNGAIYVDGADEAALTIQNVSIDVAGANNAIRANGDVDIKITGATITAVADPSDLNNIPSTDFIYSGHGDITVTKSAIRAGTIEGKNLSQQFASIANQSEDGKVTIDSSTIDVTSAYVGGTCYSVFGLQGGTVEILNNSNLTLNSEIAENVQIVDDDGTYDEGLSGIHAVDKLSISNSKVTVTLNNNASNSEATFAYGLFSLNIDITQNSKVTVSANGSNQAIGIALDTGSLSVDTGVVLNTIDSEVTTTGITGKDAEAGIGIHALGINSSETAYLGDVDIQGSTIITSGTGGNGYGIESNTIEINNSQVTATGTGLGETYSCSGVGFYPVDSVSVSGNSDVTASGLGKYQGNGISTGGDMSVIDSTVTAIADTTESGELPETASFVEIYLYPGILQLEGAEILRGNKSEVDLGQTYPAYSGMFVTWITESEENYSGGTSIIGIATTGISLNQTTLSLNPGDTERLTATLTPANASLAPTWTSSNEDVATVTVSEDGSVTVTAVAVGTATITVTAGDDNAITATCAVTVTDSGQTTPATPSGGSSDPSYSPVLDVSDGGTVTTNPRTPGAGDEVTITPSPDEGFAVDEVTVTDRNGYEIGVTDNGDGTYTFEQPRGRVTISVTFCPAGLPFVDVPGDYWAYDAIAWAYGNGYMNGVTAARFQPEGTISRQQVWMILARLSGESPASMAEARQWAVDSGISDGTNPGAAVTRQQLAALLYRYAALMGYANDHRADLSIYPDAGTVTSYAVEPMQWAVAYGILTGTADGRLNPTGTATRAHAAVMLMRFCQLDK